MDDTAKVFDSNETVFLIEAEGAEEFLNNPESSFIGRESLLEKFSNAISNAKEQGVSILVSGYRGTGKTLFVKQAIDAYKKKQSRKIWRIRLNLGANRRVSYRDVLHEILSEVNVRVSRCYYSSLAFVASARIFSLLVLMNFMLVFFYPKNIADEFVFLFSFFINISAVVVYGVKFIRLFIIAPILLFENGFLGVMFFLKKLTHVFTLLVFSSVPVFVCAIFLLSMASGFYGEFYNPSAFLAYFFDFFKWANFVFEGSFHFKWLVLEGWGNGLPLFFWFVIFSLIFIFLLSEVFLYRLKNIRREIKGLLESIENKTSARRSLDNKFMVPYFSFGFFNEKSIEKNILSDGQIEARLASIIDTISKKGAAGLVSLENFDEKNKWDYRYDGVFSFFINVKKLSHSFFWRNKVAFIFIFDELDKLDSVDADVYADGTKRDDSSNANKSSSKNVTEDLLGSMKSLIKDSSATYIFISDREASDIYYSESGSKNALYQGVFDLVLNIPSLLLDDSDGGHNTLHSMISSYVIASMKIYVEGFCDEKSKKYPKINNFKDYVEQGLLACSGVNLTDHDRVLQENMVYIVNRFIRYLTFHSAGNCRRLSTIMRQYITIFDQSDIQENYVGRSRIDLGNEQSIYVILDANRDQWSVKRCVNRLFNASHEKRYFLKFSLRDVSTFSMASNIYEAVQWKMGHELSNSDDKLVFSSFNALMDILKFHEIGFTRHYLDRTSEAIDKFSEPHFPYVANDLLEQVLYPFLRKIRRGVFQYRFYSFVEEDIRYISKMSSVQSSVYNFGLDSFGVVKQHYLNFLNDMDKGDQSRSIVYSILGDINLWEKRLDEARSYYTKALTIFESELSNIGLDDEFVARVDVRYGKTLLKCGLVEATRNNHFVAMDFYKKLLNYLLKIESSLESESLFYFGEIEDTQLRELYVHAINSINSISLKLGHVFQDIVPYQSLASRQCAVDKGLLLKCLSVEFSSNAYQRIALDLIDYIKNTASSIDKPNKEAYALIMVHVVWVQSMLILSVERFVSENSNDLASWRKFLNSFMDVKIEESTAENIVNNMIDFEEKKCFSCVVVNAFKYLYLLAEKMSLLNYPIRSAFLLNNILTSWIALLELYPFSVMDSVAPGSPSERETPPWIIDIRYKLLRYTQQSTGGIFENNTVLWSSESGNLSPLLPKFYNKLYSNDEQDFDPKLHVTSRYIYWNRNSLQMLSRMICFWEAHARSRLLGDEKNHSGFLVHEIIPINHKSTSIHLWLRGRSRALFVKHFVSKNYILLRSFSNHYVELVEGDNLSCLNDYKYDFHQEVLDFLKSSCETIYDYYQSININRSFTVSGDPQTIPIKFGIVFQLYELMHELSMKFNFDSLILQKCLIQTQRLVNKSHGASVLDTPPDYFNLHQMGKLAEAEIRDLQAFGTLDSSTYRQSLGTRYYLYDDYEDPMFKIEWTYLNIAKLGAGSHLQQLEKMRKDYKNRFNNSK